MAHVSRSGLREVALPSGLQMTEGAAGAVVGEVRPLLYWWGSPSPPCLSPQRQKR